MRNLIIKLIYQLGIFILSPMLLFQCGGSVEIAPDNTSTTSHIVGRNSELEVTEDMIQLARDTRYNILAETLHMISLSQEIVTNKQLALFEAIQLGKINIIELV